MDNTSDTLSLDKLCDGIRKNDPNIHKLLIPVYKRSHVDSLLNALRENRTVTSLVLELTDTCSETDPSFASLLQYLKNSTTIRSMELAECRDSGFIPAVSTRSLLIALAENRNMELDEFQSGSRVALDCSDLTALLESNAHCLQRLHIQHIPYNEEVSRLTQLVQAVGLLRVLESVDVRFPSSGYTTVMLENMNGHPCLRKLSLMETNNDSVPVIVEALCTLLQSGVRLETLELFCFDWDDGIVAVKKLMQGLGACQTLLNLTLAENNFPQMLDEEDIACAFGDGVCKCQNIRQLRILDCSASSFVASSALMPAESDNTEAASTNGLSSLQVLDVSDNYEVDDIEDVLKPLTMPCSQLLELSLGSLTEDVFPQLADFLPDLHFLRELTLQFQGDMDHIRFSPHSFLHALRRNGSLHRVSVALAEYNGREYRYTGAWLLVGSDSPWMQAFCDRNCLAPGLLQSNAQTPLSLVPSLYKTVTQSLRMAPTNLLAGLLAADDAIGYDGHEKRTT
jgi:hypothetical protein